MPSGLPNLHLSCSHPAAETRRHHRSWCSQSSPWWQHYMTSCHRAAVSSHYEDTVETNKLDAWQHFYSFQLINQNTSRTWRPRATCTATFSMSAAGNAFRPSSLLFSIRSLRDFSPPYSIARHLEPSLAVVNARKPWCEKYKVQG